MSLQITSLKDVDVTTVQEFQEELSEILQNQYPEINLRHGVMHDLVQYINAIFAAKLSTELTRYRQASSLLSIQKNPELADEDTVNQLLSNYNITRRGGTPSRGNLTLEFTSDVTSFLPSGTAFTTGGRTFETVAPITLYKSTTNRTATSSERILRRLPDGCFGCSIPVQATVVGATTVSKGTAFSSESSMSNLFKVFASESFAPGSEIESNSALMTRMQAGIATPCWGNRWNIEHLIESESGLDNLIAISVVGMGDVEMQRDKAPLLPFSSGGKTDIYVKSQPSITYETVSATALRIGDSVDKIRWQVFLPDQVGGYGATSINLPGVSGAGYNIISQSVLSNHPELTDEDAAFSCYQNLLVVFETDDIDTRASSLPVDVAVMRMDGLQSVQDVLTDRRFAPINSDVLVKACVPALVDVHLSIMASTEVSSDVQAQIRTAVTTLINSSGFTGILTSGQVMNAIHGILPSDACVYSLDLSCDILSPGMDTVRTVNTSKIDIPSIPDKYITKNTVSWFTRDITITQSPCF